MKTFFHNLALSLASGTILTFFSEFAFYGQFNEPGAPPATATDFLWLFGAYTLMAYLFLAAMRHYRVNSIPALLVLGAAYGWMLEGGIVATLYEDLPWSISFTALAWHMPIDVLFGWYFIQKWLRERRFSFNLRAAALTGLLWGFWAVWPSEVIALRPTWFAAFAFGMTVVLLVAYEALDRLGLNTFRPTRGGALLAGGLFLVFYLTSTAFAVPLSLVLLPLLLGLCWFLLRRSARTIQTPDYLAQLSAPLRRTNLLAWLAFPFVAAVEYTFWANTGWRIPSNVIGWLITVPLGFGLFVWAMWAVWRHHPATGTSR